VIANLLWSACRTKLIRGRSCQKICPSLLWPDRRQYDVVHPLGGVCGAPDGPKLVRASLGATPANIMITYKNTSEQATAGRLASRSHVCRWRSPQINFAYEIECRRGGQEARTRIGHTVLGGIRISAAVRFGLIVDDADMRDGWTCAIGERDGSMGNSDIHQPDSRFEFG
jgi:hypothetical protein